MTTFFDDESSRASLLAEAEKWKGTPWGANSEARGHAVSCHNLPRALFVSCAALSIDFPRVIGNPAQSRFSKVSVMEKFLDSRSEFLRVGIREPLVCGDLLGLRIYSCIDHLAVYLGGGDFIHVLMHKKTDVDSINVPPWSQRLLGVWRIK